MAVASHRDYGSMTVHMQSISDHVYYNIRSKRLSANFTHKMLPNSPNGTSRYVEPEGLEYGPPLALGSPIWSNTAYYNPVQNQLSYAAAHRQLITQHQLDAQQLAIGNEYGGWYYTCS